MLHMAWRLDGSFGTWEVKILYMLSLMTNAVRENPRKESL
jgi:hypothetical protein